MNRRGKRLTLGVVAVGLAVALVFGIANWGTLRDHVEAWHFQLTRETRIVQPRSVGVEAWEWLSTEAGDRPLIFAAEVKPRSPPITPRGPVPVNFQSREHRSHYTGNDPGLLYLFHPRERTGFRRG